MSGAGAVRVEWVRAASSVCSLAPSTGRLRGRDGEGACSANVVHQLVLDTPMGAGDCQHARWRPPSRQQEVSNNWWLLGIADPALQLDTCERFDSREVVLARESCRRHDHRLAPFVADMAAGERLLYLRMFCQ